MTWIDLGDVAGVPTGAAIRSAPDIGRSSVHGNVAAPHQTAPIASPCPRNDSQQGMNDAFMQTTGGPAEAGGITS